jgi:hypothetical protein
MAPVSSRAHRQRANCSGSQPAPEGVQREKRDPEQSEQCYVVQEAGQNKPDFKHQCFTAKEKRPCTRWVSAPTAYQLTV